MKTMLTLLASVLLFACSKPQPPVDDRAERNKERITEFYAKLVNSHNAEMVDSFFTTDIRDHHDAVPEPIVGLENIRAGFREFFATFPDAHLDVDFLVAEGDTVVAKVKMTGTNTGPMRGGPSTGKSIDINGTAVFALRNGKIYERWRSFDDLKMAQQLGMIPGGDE